ncbi:MAG: hypothetical protein K2X93_16330 [Candidatus Obscuribacterales bacterium]|nr:hypothetical protein [Candidatus Obscuribacterales bacterium]
MGIVIVLVVMALVDMIFLVLANSLNDTAVKNAARAAANQKSSDKAKDAAKKALSTMRCPPYVSRLVLEKVNYVDNDVVTCNTRMVVKLPVPVFGIASEYEFVGQDTEPIVASAD